MKAFLVVLAFTLVFHTKQQIPNTPEHKAAFQANVTLCSQENGVDPSITGLIWTQPDGPATNNPLKCFYKCLLVNLAIIDASGNLSDGTLMKGFSYYDNTTEVQEIGDDCKNVPSNTDLCVYAYQLLKCVALIELGQNPN